MIGKLPRPLEDEWRDALAAVARERRLPSFDDPARLAPHVSALADAYNDASASAPRLAGEGHLAARLGFSFVRDVPKVAGAVRELIAIGRVRVPADRALRVLDLGAGMGASHRGLARALDAASQVGAMEVVAIDSDSAALEIARAIAVKRPSEGGVTIELRTEVASLSALPRGRGDRGRYDVILCGQVLSELDRDRSPDERIDAHRALLASLVRDTLSADGTLVVVEPALRARARHLQRVRSALLAASEARVLAPCLHEGRCPLLGRETDWCHEDLAVDLPQWLVPVAKRAGLRWEGLTFSYLALAPARPTARSLREAIHAGTGGAIERAVSGALVSKGKRELVVCGDTLRPAVGDDDLLGPHGARIGRLDREASPLNVALANAGRGDVLELCAPLDDKLRVRRDGLVRAIERVAPPSTDAPPPSKDSKDR